MKRAAGALPSVAGGRLTVALEVYTLNCPSSLKGCNSMSFFRHCFRRQNHPRFLDELRALLRIPSVSTLPEHKGDCRKAARRCSPSLSASEWSTLASSRPKAIRSSCRLAACCGKAHRAHLRPLRCPASRPARRVALSALRAYRAKRQPLRPRRGRRQSQVVAQVKAPRVVARRQTTALPINVAFFSKAKKRWEGGNRRLRRLQACRSQADFALVSDTELFAPGLPTLCVGLRGMIYTELEVAAQRAISTPECMEERLPIPSSRSRKSSPT